MIPKNTAHSLLIAAMVVSTGFAVRTSLANLRTSARTSDIAEMSDMRPGQLMETPCANGLTGSNCLSVPVAVEGKDANGNFTTVLTSYEVGPSLVGQIRRDFAQRANVVLRQIRPIVERVAVTSSPEAKIASESALDLINKAVPYRVQPGITIPFHVEEKVAEIAQKQYSKSGRPIVITSGTRTAISQADAMRTKLKMGDNVMRLYRDKRAVASVVKAYKSAKHLGADDGQVTEQMANVIEKQVEKGVFISRHLKAGAVDIRTYDLSSEERQELMAAIHQTPGVVKTIQESTPPHLHVELE